MSILDFSTSDAAIEEGIPAILRAVREAQEPPSLVVVAGMERSQERLIEAGARSAAQDLVLGSTIAEGTRTRYLQVAHQFTKPPLRQETENLLSHLFEELTQLLEGIYLIGELSPQGRRIVGSYGERAVALIVAQALRQDGLQAQALCDRQVYLAVGPASANPGEKVVKEFRRELAALSQDGIIGVIPHSLRSATGK